MARNQILVTETQAGLTPYKEPVWNPLLFLRLDEPEDNLVDINFAHQIEQAVDIQLNALGVPVLNVAPWATYGMEVGDDRVDLSHSTTVLGRQLVVQEMVFKMKTSEKDTFISKRCFNFCEVTSSIPFSPRDGLEYCKRSESLKNLSFTDCPVLRLTGNVQKGDRSHSSSATGKASLLARKMISPRESNAASLELASWIQDGTLNVVKSREPKYLPGIMGGAGAPPLWGNAYNTYLFLKTFKAGSYDRVYGTAINEAKQCVEQMDAGQTARALLCERLREKQDYLHATYAEQVFLPPHRLKDELGMSLPPPICSAPGVSAVTLGTERRLIATKRVITRSQALIEQQRATRISQSLLGLIQISEVERLEREKSREASERYDFALSANAAVQRLLSRSANGTEAATLYAEGFLSSGAGVQRSTPFLVEWIAAGGRGNIYTVDDIVRSEDLFARDEVSLDDTLKVPGIQLNAVLREKILSQTTIAKVGLWQVSKSQEEWADEVVNQLKALRDEGFVPDRTDLLRLSQENTEWVSDDPLIAQQVADLRRLHGPVQTIAIVTADNKLCRQISRNTGLHVLEISPEWVILSFPRDTWDFASELTQFEQEALLDGIYIGESVPKPKVLIFDFGALKASAMKFDKAMNDHGHKTGPLKKVEPLWEEVIDGHRVSRTKEIQCEVPLSFRARIYAANGVMRPATVRPQRTTRTPPPTWQRRASSLVAKAARKFSSG
jgi:hypothetical protein